MIPTGNVAYVTVVVKVPVDRIRRLRNRFGTRFLERCFTVCERTLALRRRNADRALAVRWAARSAVRVALRELGCEGVVNPDDAVVVHDSQGAPILRVGGALSGRLSVAGLSLAHDGDDAVAALLARRPGPAPAGPEDPMNLRSSDTKRPLLRRSVGRGGGT